MCPSAAKCCSASATAGAVRNRMDACSRTGRLTKTAGVDPKTPSARCRRRGETMMNPSTSRDRDSAALHLLVRVLAGVHQEHLQIALPGRPLHRSHQGREVRVGDVGDDHRDVPRPSRDQAPGGTVRHEAEFPHRFLDSTPGFGSDLLGDVDGARDRCRMHAGERRNVEDRCSLLASHAARPYTASLPSPRGRMTVERTAAVAREHAGPRAARTSLPEYDRSADARASLTSVSGRSPGRTLPSMRTSCCAGASRR